MVRSDVDQILIEKNYIVTSKNSRALSRRHVPCVLGVLNIILNTSASLLNTPNDKTRSNNTEQVILRLLSALISSPTHFTFTDPMNLSWYGEIGC